jgi:thioredoxin 1
MVAPPAALPPPVPTRLPQLIELGSKTCIPCKKMAPILEELRQQYSAQLEVIFYDIYERRDMAEAYAIRVIPTQVFLDSEGKEFFRHQGFYPKEEILARFREYGTEVDSK